MKTKDTEKKDVPLVPVPPTEKPLSEEEDKFCELYVSGRPLFTDNYRQCYEEVFGKGKNIPIASRALPHPGPDTRDE